MTAPSPPYLVPLLRGVLRLHGPDTVAFLQGMLSNDIRRVSTERAVYAALLSPQGKFLHDVFICSDGEALYLDTEYDRREEFLKRLRMYRLRADVDIEDVSDAFRVLALYGTGAMERSGLPAEAVLGQAAAWNGGMAYRDPRHPELSVRVCLPAASATALLEEMPRETPDTYDALRIRLSVPDGSRDMEVDKALLMDCDFEALHGVDFDKGCYVGQEVTARMKHRNVSRKRLAPVRCLEGRPETGDTLLWNGKPAGRLGSIAGGLALAHLRREALEEGAVYVTPAGARLGLY